MPEARYDGHATWYDDVVSRYEPGFTDLVADQAAEFAERGAVVLDVGCGTGLYFGALRERGLKPVGVDLSADQLRFAHERESGVIRGDVTALPVRDSAVPVAVGAFIHTDVDDFSSTTIEVARVLRADGRFVYIGTHPCFVGRFVPRGNERDRRELIVQPGYGDAGLSFDAGRASGLSARVGFRSRSLTELLGAFVRAGLSIESFEELDTEGRPWAVDPDDGTIVPWNVLVVAAKPPAVRTAAQGG